MQDHKIGGSSPLKTEIRRLAAGISYASSQVEIISLKPKLYNVEEIGLVLKSLESHLTGFIRSYTNIVRKNREKRR